MNQQNINNGNLNIEIVPGAALDDAAEIGTIITNIKDAMEQLNTIFTKTAPGMQLEWAENLRAEWQSFYNESIPAAMDNIAASASNLQTAADAARRMSQGK